MPEPRTGQSVHKYARSSGGCVRTVRLALAYAASRTSDLPADHLALIPQDHFPLRVCVCVCVCLRVRACVCDACECTCAHVVQRIELNAAKERKRAKALQLLHAPAASLHQPAG